MRSKPIISPNYLSTEEDCNVAVESIELTRKIINQNSFKIYNPIEYKPGSHLISREELINAARGILILINIFIYIFNLYILCIYNLYILYFIDIGTTIFHPVGTCKMGLVDDNYAVVDNKLKVFGIHGLRIADASIMPIITSGNTAAPSMMIGEKCAMMILNETK